MSEEQKKLSTESNGELPEANKTDSEEKNNAEVALSLKSDTAYLVRDKHRELMKTELAQLPPLKKGEIDIHGSYIVSTEEKVEVGFYLRNGNTHPIRFGNMSMVITNLENEVLAKQDFNLSKLGRIPAYSARPGEVFFDRENIYVENIPQDNWEINFEYKPKLERFANIRHMHIPKNFTKQQIAALKKHLEQLPPIKPGKLRISPLQVKMEEQKGLLATVIIRNGSEREVQIKSLNLALRDAKRRKVAYAPFKINNFSVKPLSAHLWTFTFPPESFLEKDMDLSRWSIEIIQKQH